MILIQHARRSLQVQVLFVASVPGQFRDGLQVRADHLRFHGVRSSSLETEELPVDFFPGLFWEIEFVQTWEFGAEVFDPDCMALVEAAARDLGVGHKRMLSQAGHDAYNMTKVCPTALIFSPCKDGITHNEAEHIEPGYTIPAVNVLLQAVVARANR